MTDQQRSDSLGCYGMSGANTPNLDRLAADGVRFDPCYVTSPICTPSRASLFTGKHITGHGVYQLYDNLPEDEVLFPARLRERGYQTALIGKLHVSSIDREAYHRHPNDGFEIYEPCNEGPLRMDAPYQAYARWLKERNAGFYERYKREGRQVGHVPEACHFTTWAAERTEHFLETRDASRPFCAFMSLFDPHNPYDNHPESAEDLVDPDDLPPPLTRETKGSPEPEDLHRERTGSYLGQFDGFNAGELRDMRHGYQVAVAFADRAFGRVLRKLDELGLREDTLVVMLSDHGDMLGDHRLFVKGAFFYDPAVKVPLIMRWPARLPSGRVISSLVSNLDVAATILDAAGFAEEEIVSCAPESHSLLPLAEGRLTSVREEVVSVFRNSGLSNEPSGNPYWEPPIHATMLRHGRWKIWVYHGGEDRDWTAQGCLFDMIDDPCELENLFDDPAHAGVRRDLTDRLMNWFVRQQLQFGGRAGRTFSQVKIMNTLK
jgi:arylsulfatase